MLTTIAALYVILPALYALICCALAMSPVRISEPTIQREVFALAVVECQRRAERYVQAMALLVPLLATVSWDDQCSVAVYDYAEMSCYVEDAELEDAVCSEFRVYYPCTVSGVHTVCDWSQ